MDFSFFNYQLKLKKGYVSVGMKINSRSLATKLKRETGIK